MDRFFVGWHQPCNGYSGCHHFENTMISVNRLIKRKSRFLVNNWILDSGAFTRITSKKGHLPVKKYAKEIKRWSTNGNLLAAVSQDYMCESFVLEITGLTIEDHQRLTIHRYKLLKREIDKLECNTYLMPVLQGFTVNEYLNHLKQYGDTLKQGMWVGVGSVCKRNSSPAMIEAILLAIKKKRPDLQLHGFGIKKTALSSGLVNELLYSADSQAHSFGASGQRKYANASNPMYAKQYAEKLLKSPLQLSLETLVY